MSVAVKLVLVCCTERFGSSIPVSKAIKEKDHFIIDYIALSFYDFAVSQTPNEDFLPIHMRCIIIQLSSLHLMLLYLYACYCCPHNSHCSFFSVSCLFAIFSAEHSNNFLSLLFMYNKTRCCLKVSVCMYMYVCAYLYIDWQVLWCNIVFHCIAAYLSQQHAQLIIAIILRTCLDLLCNQVMGSH